MIYKLLNNPGFYSFAQRLFSIGGRKLLNDMLNEMLSSLSHCHKILDVGCGPRSKFYACNLEQLPIGYDLSEDYIRSYCLDSTIGCVGSADKLPFSNNEFNAVFSFGLFHHLPTSIASAGVSEMIRTCKPKGRVIIWDAVLPQNKFLRPQAYLIRRLDRGNHMRNQSEFVTLLPSCEKWNVQRYTYNSITKVELIISQFIKE